MPDLSTAIAALTAARRNLQGLLATRQSKSATLTALRRPTDKRKAAEVDPAKITRLEQQIDRLTTEITDQALMVGRLEAEVLARVLEQETAETVPALVDELARLWAVHVRVEYPARSLGSFAAHLLAAPLRALNAAARDDPRILDSPLSDIRRKHQLDG